MPRKPERDVESDAVDRRASVISYREDAKLDEYTRLVRFMSTYQDKKRDPEEGEIRESRVWYAPWQKKKYRWKYIGSAKEYPEEWRFTDIYQGLSVPEVETRQRTAGFNELTAEKTNQFRKVLGYFQGPILYGRIKSMKSPINLHLLMMQTSYGACRSARGWPVRLG